ncbi:MULTISPECIES: LysM peptidoglycan-binding domain-containing protein [unclassified Pseudoalteromonas]|uniref:LysM peptidoglycan-binding domain-containing protein n=1 Tax=unclassified Pseudoalteromonas TaxID=194690 RepID=UPI0030151426
MNTRLIQLLNILSVLLLIAGCQSTAPPQVDRQAILSAITHVPAKEVASERASAPQAEQAKPVTRKPKSEKNLWHYVRNKLYFNTAPHPRLKKRIDWYLTQPHYLNVVSRRAAPYFYHVVKKIERRGLPMELALLPFVESDFRPTAKSSQNAVGVWQLVDATAYHFGIKKDAWYDGRQDVLASTDAALDYLSYLHERFDGDWLHAIAAYNSGEARVKQAIRKNRRQGKPTHFWHLKLPQETSEYVPKLLALSHLLKTAPAKFTIPELPNKATTALLDVGQQFDLDQLAKLTGVKKRQLYQLNPGFLQHRSSPKGPHTILLPMSEQALLKSAFFRNNFSQGYIVQKNDTLYGIARKAGMSVTALKSLNNKTSDLIRVGETLLISQGNDQLDLVVDYEVSPYIKQPNTAAKEQPKVEHQHTVSRGESLWTISRQYQVTVRDLLDWNELTAKAVLRPGDELRLLLSAPKPNAESNDNKTPLKRATGMGSYGHINAIFGRELVECEAQACF